VNVDADPIRVEHEEMIPGLCDVGDSHRRVPTPSANVAPVDLAQFRSVFAGPELYAAAKSGSMVSR
jgi:hypothetical protein